MHHRTVYLALSLLACLSASTTSGDTEARPDPSTFKVLVRESGVYRIEHRQLVEAGLDPTWEGDGVRLTQGGVDVPLWRSDAQQSFGPGDALVFRGEALHGEPFFFHDHSDTNVYILELGGASGPEMRSLPAPSRPRADLNSAALERRVHHERDELLLRFSTPPVEQRDSWFWAKLSQIDEQPFELQLDLSNYDPTGWPLSLEVALRGWSYQGRGSTTGQPDHLVEVALNGHPLTTASWQQQDEHVVEIDAVDVALLQTGLNRLTIRVPKRQDDRGEELIDVVLLNWIDVRHGRGPDVETGQETVWVAASDDPIVRLETAAPALITLFSTAGTRHEVTSLERDGVTRHYATLDEATAQRPTEVTVVVGDTVRSPAAVIAERASDLRSSTNQADYVMIAHASLLEAIEPLAEYHRQHGLAVALIDVIDVYDEFNHGILDPRAVRDFLQLAYHEWRRPAPRFVLLVGDASWDTKNEDPRDLRYADWTYRPGEVARFVKNESTSYDSGFRGAMRNLLPTGEYAGAQGHAASDNYFVAVDGDDHLPDMAIGRFPVVTPREVKAIVDKTIRYLGDSDVGPWRRNILWITNEGKGYQQRTDQLADSMAQRGFASNKVYPSAEEADNVHHQDALLAALDEGQLLVHFFGHGGRYIWRTGPPDPRKNHDLFTLDHLDQLKPHDRFPLVLSMTCYSAPFDHPSADSIGEKFLRLDDRGAVAVLAASWRNAPGSTLSRPLLKLLTETETIGEAILQAKRRLRSRDLIETYNLLGDPAIRLARPREELEVEVDQSTTGRVPVEARLLSGDELAGKMLLEWSVAGSDTTQSRQMDAVGPTFATEIRLDEDTAIEWLSLYYWDELHRRDGQATVTFSSPTPRGETAEGAP